MDKLKLILEDLYTKYGIKREAAQYLYDCFARTGGFASAGALGFPSSLMKATATLMSVDAPVGQVHDVVIAALNEFVEHAKRHNLKLEKWPGLIGVWGDTYFRLNEADRKAFKRDKPFALKATPVKSL